jgi:4-hydroxy-3-methylbut-2-enyl diphosphate reductase
MKKFDVPEFYRSSIISKIKEFRKIDDPRKKDFLPTRLDLGPVELIIARHFGFCYGVENAIDIAYKTIDENPGKNIFLLSEIIHNPVVNLDLQSRGIKFIMDIHGNKLSKWDEINSEDIVIIPAFGTAIETEKILQKKGIDIKKYNTTCPFVEKVWNRAAEIGKQNFTVIIHGKSNHEETSATFSRSTQNAPSLIILNMDEAEILSNVILENISEVEFFNFFEGKYSAGFNPEKDLIRIGVVNQTTMLASETEAISELLEETMIKKYGKENINEHFADTRDTLCYATNDNQNAAIGLTKETADLAVVVGGYNSSNTTHLVEILEEKFPTYFISSSGKIISEILINHFDIRSRKEIVTENYLPNKDKVKIAITSGASCPDSVVDEVLNKILSFFEIQHLPADLVI